MKTDKTLKLKARWDMGTMPEGKKAQRGLLLEITGRKSKTRVEKKRPPLNLALVIDRSGSMAHGSLRAAREAAIGVSEQLRKRDRLSIVAFDDHVNVLLKGVKQDKAGRKAAKEAISQLHARGTTDLGGGWMKGAQCVAGVMERKGFANGHVILLSDGHANRGIQAPETLAKHAAEMASRGVTSSCVGISSAYSPLQLDAIAEAGNGNLHHSSVPNEIIEVVLGELSELTHLAASNVEVLIKLPKGVETRQLTSFIETGEGRAVKLSIGDVHQGRTRKVAFLLDLPKGTKAGDALGLEIQCQWNEPKTKAQDSLSRQTAVKVVTKDAYDPELKNRKVARIIAELFLARLGYEAMQLNERGLYREAVETFTSSDIEIERLVSQLKEKDRAMYLRRKDLVMESVSDEWSGNSKLAAFTSAKKLMRSSHDYRSSSRDDWVEEVPD